MTDRAPTADDAIAVVRRSLGVETRAIERFPTGLANFVYDVRTVDGQQVVVRMNRPGRGRHYAATAYWHALLAPRGVPLPRLLAVEPDPADGSWPYVVQERLPGEDLQFAYPTLSGARKRALAARLAAIQRSVASLPHGPGFGYASSYADRALHPRWLDVLEASLERSRTRIAAVGAVPVSQVERVAARLPTHAAYFAAVEPRPFLDDTTTKNVIIAGGALSGIVDVDWVCFGDGLLVVALTRMALLSLRYDTAYIDCWCAELALDLERRAVLDLYTALYCLDFLGEIGQQFNKERPEPISEARIAHLLGILDGLL